MADDELDSDALIVVLETRLKDVPNSGGVHALIGRLYRRLGDCKKAERHLKRALELLPTAIVPSVELAECDALFGRWPEALNHMANAVNRAKTVRARQTLYRKSLNMALAAGDKQQIRGIWEQLQGMTRSNIFEQIKIAEEFTRAGHLHIALDAWQTLRRAVKRDPKLHLHVVLQLARVHMRLGQIAEAIKGLEIALKKVPKEHWSVGELYEALADMHRRAGTLRQWTQVLSKRKRNYPALIQLAKIYEELGDERDALAMYRVATRRRPADSNARDAVLRILKRLGDEGELEAEYRRLSNGRSADATYDLELAELYFKRNDKKRGIRTLDHIARTFSNDPGALESVAELYFMHGATKTKIEAIYLRLRRLEPGRSEHVIRLGEYYFNNNDKERAQQIWRQILHDDSSRARGHLSLARVLSDHGLEREAIAQYKQAIKAKPKTLRYREVFAQWLESTSRLRGGGRMGGDVVGYSCTTT